MDITISTLEKYCQKNGYTVITKIPTYDPYREKPVTHPFLTFVKDREDGSISIVLSYADIWEILQVNHVPEKLAELRQNPNNVEIRENLGELHIYDTLSKYIIQMLNASLGEILFRDIVPLTKHIRDFFQDE